MAGKWRKLSQRESVDFKDVVRDDALHCQNNTNQDWERRGCFLRRLAGVHGDAKYAGGRLRL